MTDQEFKKPSGTRDIFDREGDYFQKIEDTSRRIAGEYNFKTIRTPILEEKRLFVRSVGERTDIVQKEMYELTTKGGDELVLRPEGTAPIVRSYIENDLYKKPQPVKFYYFGPFFRYERPQKGRYRQFHQFGLEILGKKSPALDGQLILIFWKIFKSLQIETSVKINNLGCEGCRREYVEDLKKALKPHKESLCKNCKERFDKNTLRILDCKEEKCREVIETMPQIVDYLCKACKKNFKRVLEFLNKMELPYELDPFLVRGLDYYNNTTFEFFAEGWDFALGGGGRYDGLVEALGGRKTPACGGAVGVERTVEVMKDKNIEVKNKPKKVFLAQLGDSAKKKAFELFEEFRKEGIPVYESMGRDSLKSQMSRADKLGAEYTLILGRQECIKNQIIIREMKSGKQETVSLDEVVEEIKKRI